MTLVEIKARQVQDIFADLQTDIAAFQGNTGLTCKSGCGACCTTPDIEATVLEFLPLAIHLHKHGETDAFLARLEAANGAPTCILYHSTGPLKSGYCTNYEYRGLVCRIFGFTARRDKHGNAAMVTCRIIKELYPGAYDKAVELLRSGSDDLPFIRNYSMRLNNIDMNLASRHYPINEAMGRAIEVVEWFFHYHVQDDSVA